MMETKDLILPNLKSLFLLLSNSLMLIDIQLFVSLTKRLPIEFSESRRKLSFSLMTTSILKRPELSSSLLERKIVKDKD